MNITVIRSATPEEYLRIAKGKSSAMKMLWGKVTTAY